MKKLFVLAASIIMMSAGLSAQELANFRRERIVSPEIQNDSIIFRLDANYATQVEVFVSWIPEYGGQIPMQKGRDGIWTLKTPAPAPELYFYYFVVDGVKANDPNNYLVQRDGTSYLNTLIVPGERSANYSEAAHRGTVSFRWYDSEILGINRRLTVYTPYGYEENPKQKYPVLYLLHGAGGDEEAWLSMGHTSQILDNLIEQGKAAPMIVVMPNGNPNQQAACIMDLPTSDMNFRDPANANAYVRSLIGEIVPFIEKNYRVISKPSSRAIAGLSMGGGHTIAATKLAPGMFNYICPLSSAVRDNPKNMIPELQAIQKGGCKLYFLACGEKDFLYDKSVELDKVMNEIGFEHTFYVSAGAHTWANWRLYLNTFAPLLFK